MGWQAVVLGVLVMLNLAATRVVLRSGRFSPAQQRWQLALIWVGADHRGGGVRAVGKDRCA